MHSPSRKVDQLHLIRRWTETEARVAVEAFRASGLPVEEFAARCRLHPARVSRWASRLAASPRPMSVLPVDIAPTAMVVTPLVEVVLGARTLRVPADLDTGALTRLVRAVEAA